jgi:hypothetical protein
MQLLRSQKACRRGFYGRNKLGGESDPLDDAYLRVGQFQRPKEVAQKLLCEGGEILQHKIGHDNRLTAICS